MKEGPFLGEPSVHVVHLGDKLVQGAERIKETTVRREAKTTGRKSRIFNLDINFLKKTIENFLYRKPGKTGALSCEVLSVDTMFSMHCFYFQDLLLKDA
jgi:hypothetical protein